MKTELSEFLEAIKAQGVSVTLNPERNKRPYRCPVCNGAGNVPRNTYNPIDSSLERASCRTCGGVGALWG